MRLGYGFICIVLYSFISACAHYPDVRPAADGLHSVSFLTDRKDEGFKNAFSQAKDYCDDVHEKNALTVKENSQYVGSMDEDEYNRSKTTAKVVTAIGGVGLALGGNNERKAGGVAAAGGGIADSAIGKGYKYTLKFKCR